MRRRLARLLPLGAVLSATFLWLIAAPGVSAGDPCYHDYQIPPSTSASVTSVAFEPCAFTPTVTNVAVGSTVVFTNSSKFTHLLTGANQAWGSRDAEVAPGTTVSHAFPKAGIYPYACALHRGMSGVIVVGDAAAVLAAAIGSTSGTTAETPAATAPTSASSSIDPLAITILALTIGVVVGLAGAALVGRRRSVRNESIVGRGV